MKKIDKTAWITLALCALAASLRLWGISNGLPDVLHPDESMLIRRALRFSTGDFNPHFFFYPSLSMYLYFFLHGAYFVLGWAAGTFHSTAEFAHAFFTDPTWFYVLPRLLICLSDILSVFFLIQIGRHFFDKNIAYLAGFTWAIFPQGLSESQVAKPDPMMVSLTLLSLCLLLRADTKRKTLLSALVLGLAISAKYQAVIPVPIFMLWLLLRDHHWKERLPVTFFYGVAVVVGFVLGTPFSLLSPAEFLKDFHAQSEVMRLGMFGAEGGALGWMVYLKGLLIPGGSPPLGLAFLLGTVLCLRTKRHQALILVGIPAILYLGLSVQRIASVHYLYLAYPFVFLLAAHGFVELSKRFSRNSQRTSLWAILFLLVSLVPFYTKAWAHLRQFTDGDTRVSSRKWVEQNIPSGSRILVDADTPPLRMTPTQLEDLYQRAKAVGHVKADYFALMKQYTTEPTYEIFLTQQAVMLSPKKLVDYSRSVQNLMPIENGLDWIKAQGIQYLLVSSTEADQYTNQNIKEQHPAVAKYYEEAKERGTLLVEFAKGPRRTGPTIRIYQL